LLGDEFVKRKQVVQDKLDYFAEFQTQHVKTEQASFS